MESKEVEAPECTSKKSEPALYALSDVAGWSVVLKADFTTETKRVASSGATVRARDVSSTRVLGDSDETDLTIVDWRAERVLVRFRDHCLASGEVAVRDAELVWVCRTAAFAHNTAGSKRGYYSLASELTVNPAQTIQGYWRFESLVVNIKRGRNCRERRR